MMKLGIMTSGGDVPGMNAAISAVVKAASYHHIDLMGIQYGIQGLIDGSIYPLTSVELENITDKGGTMLKTTSNPESIEETWQDKAIASLDKFGINALVIIGGNEALKSAGKLQQKGIKVIGIPATVENNLTYTDYSIGFDTTINTILESIAKIKDTSLSHEKTTIVEVMGRNCGCLALYSALAGGGEMISTPERKLDVDTICSELSTRINNGKRDNLIIITEGLYDIEKLQKSIEEKLNIGVRSSILGILQRGGNPSAFDRITSKQNGNCSSGTIKGWAVRQGNWNKRK